jgi:hypothetical protein
LGHLGSIAWPGEEGNEEFAWGRVKGLHWSESEQRLYWAMWENYLARSSWRSYGYGTLTDSTPASYTHQAVVQFAGEGDVDETGRGPGPGTTWHKGMTEAPEDWAAQYTGGRRMLLGFGGPQSLIAYGPKSMGVALFAAHGIDSIRDQVDPVTKVGDYAGGHITLEFHPFHTKGAEVRPYWMDRGSPFADHFLWDFTTPTRWSTADMIFGAGAWVDTGTKHGLLVLAHLAAGNTHTTAAAESPAGSNTVTVVDRGNAKLGDHLLIQNEVDRVVWRWEKSGHTEVMGNGEFGEPYSLARRTLTPEMLAVNPNASDTGAYGEPVRITAIDGNVLTVESLLEDGGVFGNKTLGGRLEPGAWVIGGTWYYDAAHLYQSDEYRLYFFDPADLGRVAVGELDPDHPTLWYEAAEWQPPGFAVTNNSGFSGAEGMWFDSRTNQLWIFWGYSFWSGPRCDVYRVE